LANIYTPATQPAPESAAPARTYDDRMALPSPDPTSTCLVTGASSGIGAEIARELARRGLGLTLVARREDRLRALADELAGAHNIRAEVIACDLTDEASRGALPAAIEALGLVVDVLVNNAGFTTMGPIHKSDRAAELSMIRTDVEAVVDMCCLFVPGMATRRRGAVLNTASTAAFQPLPGQAGYGASKAFVLSYSLAIGAELKGTGVTVSALCPGPVETGFAESAGITDEEASASLPKFMWVSAARVARAGVDAMQSGKSVVIPGTANRVAAFAGYHVPRGLILPLVAKQHPALKEARQA
jgi:short-subunit dehydrogenase